MTLVHLSQTALDDKKHRSRTYNHVQIWIFDDHIRVSGYYRAGLYPLYRVYDLTEAVDLARKVKRKHEDISLRGPGVRP